MKMPRDCTVPANHSVIAMNSPDRLRDPIVIYIYEWIGVERDYI